MTRFDRVLIILFAIVTLLQGAYVYRYATQQSDLAAKYYPAVSLIQEQDQLIKLQGAVLLQQQEEIYQLKNPPPI